MKAPALFDVLYNNKAKVLLDLYAHQTSKEKYPDTHPAKIGREVGLTSARAGQILNEFREDGFVQYDNSNLMKSMKVYKLTDKGLREVEDVLKNIKNPKKLLDFFIKGGYSKIS